MSVEQTTAWRTSDGKCFVNRPEAVREEMVSLYIKLRQLAPEKPTWQAPELEKVIADTEKWLASAKELRGPKD